MSTDQQYMTLALQLAEKGRYTVSPNPMVGCVIVKDNNIIGQGFHQEAGKEHAEVIALNEAGENAQGATAYITLEACCHHGKTPPCTHALIKSGIKKIFIASLDPNPLVAGKGIIQLREAGIEIKVGLEEEKAKLLNEIFFHFIVHKTPFVIAKWAMSLDGKMVTANDDDRHISGEAAKHTTHLLRMQVDAILVGSQTAKIDNPLLTIRLPATQIKKHPLRIVLSTSGNLPTHLNLFKTSLPGKTLMVTANKDARSFGNEEQVETLVLNKSADGLIDLHALLAELGKRNISSLLVEGGRKIHDSFFKENLVNKIYTYLSPTIISNLDKKKNLTHFNHQRQGEDFIFTAGCGD